MKIKLSDIETSIKTQLQAGFTIKHYHKTKHKDWFGEVYLYPLVRKNQPIRYTSSISNTFRVDTTDIDEAAKAFVKFVFNKRNLCLAYVGIEKYNLTDKDLDDLTEEEIRELCKKYFNEYWEFEK